MIAGSSVPPRKKATAEQMVTSRQAPRVKTGPRRSMSPPMKGALAALRRPSSPKRPAVPVEKP